MCSPVREKQLLPETPSRSLDFTPFFISVPFHSIPFPSIPHSSLNPFPPSLNPITQSIQHILHSLRCRSPAYLVRYDAKASLHPFERALGRLRGRSVPQRVAEDAHEHLYRQRPGYGGEAGAGHRALLVERAIPHRVGRRDDVVAEVATDAGAARGGGRRRRLLRADAPPFLHRLRLPLLGRGGRGGGGGSGRGSVPVAHDDECVEAEGAVDDQFVVLGGEQRGQPSTFARVGQEKHRVVRRDLEERKTGEDGRWRRGGERRWVLLC